MTKEQTRKTTPWEDYALVCVREAARQWLALPRYDDTTEDWIRERALKLWMEGYEE